jgi:hypothetical protein
MVFFLRIFSCDQGEEATIKAGGYHHIFGYLASVAVIVFVIALCGHMAGGAILIAHFSKS